MELFLELALTVGFSLLLSFFISKIISMASTGDVKHGFASRSGKDIMEKAVLYDRKFGKKLRNCGTKRVKRVRFVDEVQSEPVHENFDVRSVVVCDNAEIDANEEVFREVEVVGSGESFIEECSFKEEVKAGEISLGELKEKIICAGVDKTEEKLFEESSERTEFREIEIELVRDETSLANSEEVGVLECEGNEINGINKNVVDDEEGLFDDEDDWEGIERTELEKLFGKAVLFVGCRSNDDCVLKLGGDVQMQLYGLHKIAIEGPCRELQPMALKLSARAKWNAWQQLGNMSPEVAMEQYITLLSNSISGWMGDDPVGNSKQVFSDEGASGKLASDLETFVHNQVGAQNDSKLEELKPCVRGCDLIGVGGSNSVKRDKQ